MVLEPGSEFVVTSAVFSVDACVVNLEQIPSTHLVVPLTLSSSGLLLSFLSKISVFSFYFFFVCSLICCNRNFDYNVLVCYTKHFWRLCLVSIFVATTIAKMWHLVQFDAQVDWKTFSKLLPFGKQRMCAESIA